MKKGRAKKLLGICIFLMGLMIFSVLPVQAAAPRMYTIQPGKTWTKYDITGDGKKDRIKVVRKKSQYDGCWIYKGEHVVDVLVFVFRFILA